MDLLISRVRDEGLQPLGAIDKETGEFRYLTEYLLAPDAMPVSQSLPLQDVPFDAHRTACYFEGLLPEGETRSRTARDIGVSQARYLDMLERLGNDCVADLFIGDDPTAYRPHHEALPYEKVLATAVSAEESAASNSALRLSLAGNQTKTGLAHDTASPLDEAWYLPLDGAASTHILKSEGEFSVVPSLEYLCMNTAKLCGISAAETSLITSHGTDILVSRRFDREVSHSADGSLSVRRLHQEDFAQALGLPATGEDKYDQIPGGSFHAIADFLYERSSQPILDIAQLARLAFYNYLIGNCDAHLKNWSILHSDDWTSLHLAPAYDLVGTVRFEKYSRDMAMAYGSVRDIDEIDSAALERFCDEIALPRAAGRSAAAELVGHFDAALAECVSNATVKQEDIEYEADNLRYECAPRLLTLEEFGRS